MATRRSLPVRLVVVGGLVALFAAAFVAAAYYEWFWWEPYNALLPYLGEAVLFVVAIVLALVPGTRRLALVPGLVGLGLVAGQVLGPSRPELAHGEGTITVRLTEPVVATGTAAATCATSDGGTELQISGDPNLRMAIVPDDPGAPADVDQREIVGVYLTVGDRWRRSLRADEAHFGLSLGRVEADLAESRMMSDASSTLTVDGTPESGRVQFADLVLETRVNEQVGDFIDVAGTVEWTCAYRDEPPTEGGAAPDLLAAGRVTGGS
jgi:hypothetical protein